jgi:hypothetical protein
MIRRVYFCTDESCGYTYEIYQSLSDGIDRICPSCKQETLFQDLTNVHGSTSDAKTVGMLAEKNAAKFGKHTIERLEYEREQKIQKDKEENRRRILEANPGAKIVEKTNEKPWYGELPKDVKKDILTSKGKDRQKKVEKYINGK